MDTQKLNKKLAEWAGFRFLPVVGYEGSVWVEPDWKYGNGKWGIELPNFTNSLDACFKWLVPKLWLCDLRLEEGIFFVWTVGYPQYGTPKRGIADENPALALCLAISKLIDSESKDA